MISGISALAPSFSPGDSPLLISVPHAGREMSGDIERRLTAAARGLPDTDFFVDRLYDWAGVAGAGVLVAAGSRYVVDLNRPPDDSPLYDRSATQLMTGVVPLQSFDGEPLYREGEAPDDDEIDARLQDHWQPYHDLLAAELERIRSRHGHAVLLDAHSIRQRLPLLFEGTLPHLNLGSDGGRSAAASLLESARGALETDAFDLVVDGRFRGGYITRHYGQPDDGVHALQLEIAQAAYMQEYPPAWDAERSRRLQRVLQGFVGALIDWSPDDR